jgi:adenylate kinase
MLHTVVLIGRSGCGKGTQADLLRERIAKDDESLSPILYVETGEHFRRFIERDAFSSKISKKAYETDERQPDFLACWMWSDVLVQQLDEGMHLIFDGAPRSRPEAEILTTALEFYKREKPTIIHIKVSRTWSEERLLKRGRSDDKTLSKINKRLDWFERDVSSTIEYFKNNPLYRFIEINGEQPIDKVHSDIIAAYDYEAKE